MGIETGQLSFQPVGPERWGDFENLFGANGACAGCWCMWWRETRGEYSQFSGEGNKQRMREIILAGRVPGLIAYLDDLPVGWVSVAPREEFPSLDRSRVAKRVDERPVWSLVCFFIRKGYRRQGLTGALIRAAAAYAREQGAEVLEAYPVEHESKVNGSGEFTGFASTFRRAGFVEAARRSEKRPVMRLELRPKEEGANE